ncbi:MAG TPA: hypothetical protein VFJ15_09235 [Oleiagrimonas sp.]|nr:hypothetical protein [Oleiagrimonas sp.]
MKTRNTALAIATVAALALSLSTYAATPTGRFSSPMQMASSMSNPSAASNWFGGPIYSGKPALAATHALVKAGGGAADFKFSTALVAMLGEKTVHAEVAKLSKQYGKQETEAFIKNMTIYVNDALKRATEQGIKLPPPADLHGAALAKALVKAGTTPDGTFWSGYFFDQTISHKLHNQVMADIDARYGHDVDARTHKILNQAMYDVAQALGMKHVKLASFH